MAGRSDLDSDSGVASGSREPYSGPSDGHTTADRLHDVDPADGGMSLEDHQRDRGGNGVRGGYDDAVKRRGQAGDDRLGVSRGD